MSVRPAGTSAPLDPLSDIIESLHLSTQVHGHFDRTPPFALSIDARADVDVLLMAVLRGTASVAVKGVRPTMLSAGDIFLQTQKGPLDLRDAPTSRAPVEVVSTCPTATRALRRDAAPPSAVSFVGVGFRISAPAKERLLAQLPPLLVIAPDASPTLAPAATLFRAEATSPQSGSRALLGRLGEVIFIDVLRRQGERKEGACGDLKGLCDPPLAKAIALVHARPATDWTIESLGRAAGLSRSAFAARFHEKVGEPPLQYVARWRMMRAAELLKGSDTTMGEVAMQVGYRSEASFSRAFTRHIGLSPGLYRRRARAERRAP